MEQFYWLSLHWFETVYQVRVLFLYNRKRELGQSLFLHRKKRICFFLVTCQKREKAILFSNNSSHTCRTGECIHYVELGWALSRLVEMSEKEESRMAYLGPNWRISQFQDNRLSQERPRKSVWQRLCF